MGAARSTATQGEWDSRGLYLLGNISVDDDTSLVIIPPEEGEEMLEDEMSNIAWDDVSGEALDPEKVKEARRAEMCYYSKMGVYRKAPISERFAKTGKAPIGVRWVDVNKGDRKSSL